MVNVKFVPRPCKNQECEFSIAQQIWQYASEFIRAGSVHHRDAIEDHIRGQRCSQPGSHRLLLHYSSRAILNSDSCTRKDWFLPDRTAMHWQADTASGRMHCRRVADDSTSSQSGIGSMCFCVVHPEVISLSVRIRNAGAADLFNFFEHGTIIQNASP